MLGCPYYQENQNLSKYSKMNHTPRTPPHSLRERERALSAHSKQLLIKTEAWERERGVQAAGVTLFKYNKKHFYECFSPTTTRRVRILQS